VIFIILFFIYLNVAVILRHKKIHKTTIAKNKKSTKQPASLYLIFSFNFPQAVKNLYLERAMSAAHSCTAIKNLFSLNLMITNKLLFLFYQLCPFFLP